MTPHKTGFYVDTCYKWNQKYEEFVFFSFISSLEVLFCIWNYTHR